MLAWSACEFRHVNMLPPGICSTFGCSPWFQLPSAKKRLVQPPSAAPGGATSAGPCAAPCAAPGRSRGPQQAQKRPPALPRKIKKDDQLCLEHLSGYPSPSLSPLHRFYTLRLTSCIAFPVWAPTSNSTLELHRACQLWGRWEMDKQVEHSRLVSRPPRTPHKRALMRGIFLHGMPRHGMARHGMSRQTIPFHVLS